MKTFSLAVRENKLELIKITAVCFDEPTTAVGFFFENRANLNNCYICKIGDEIVSILHIFSMKLKLNGKIFDSYYIYGACTLPEYRHKGYMRQLLEFTENELKKKNADFIFLVPEEKTLENFYKKYGYVNFFKTKTVTLSNSEFKNLSKGFSFKNLNNTYLHIEKLRKKLYNNINNIIYESDDIKYAILLYEFFGGKTVATNSGYAICSPELKNSLVIRDFACIKKYTPELIAKIYSLFPNKKEYIIKTSPANTFFNGCGECDFYGMIKPLKKENEKIVENIICCGEFPYVGLAYD